MSLCLWLFVRVVLYVFVFVIFSPLFVSDLFFKPLLVSLNHCSPFFGFSIYRYTNACSFVHLSLTSSLILYPLLPEVRVLSISAVALGLWKLSVLINSLRRISTLIQWINRRFIVLDLSLTEPDIHSWLRYDFLCALCGLQMFLENGLLPVWLNSATML